MAKLSVVINTLNEAKNLPDVVRSIDKLADEIVVVDMESTDGTLKVAKSLGAKVFSHKKLSYVEPARNFGVSKSMCEWILILDVDEIVTPTLAKKIKEIIKSGEADYYRIPRKNIIFGKWIAHTRWWPDYNIRLFKKGFVIWNEEIHSVPFTKGVGSDLAPEEELAIVHNSYSSIDDYLDKVFRYTKIQSEELVKKGYKFKFEDIIKKPLSEFLSRYFAGSGYKDGLHGLVLSLLQAFSELVLYVRVWSSEGFKEKNISNREIKTIFKERIKEIQWWITNEFPTGIKLWLKNQKSH